MNNAAKNLFVKLWSAEYSLTKEVNILQERSDMAYKYGEPTARLEGRINTINKKLSLLGEKIAHNIQKGVFSKDAVLKCTGLGDIGGYVVDCYHEYYQDYVLAQNGSN
jgi:hypothetical protein